MGKGAQGGRSIGDVLLAAEALMFVALARIVVAALPFRLLAAWMSRPSGRRAAAASPDRLRLAVERARRYSPWRCVCIHHGVALHRMLRRRGYPSHFVYGLSSAEGALEAHVWVELDGAVVAGGDEAATFQPVATFPDDLSGRPRPKVSVDCVTR